MSSSFVSTPTLCPSTPSYVCTKTRSVASNGYEETNGKDSYVCEDTDGKDRRQTLLYALQLYTPLHGRRPGHEGARVRNA